MQENLKTTDRAEAQCVMGNGAHAGIKLGGKFDVTCYRDGQLLWEEHVHNIVTTEGQNAVLNGIFHTAGFTVPATWFVGLVETDTAPDVGLTYHTPSFTESQSYDNIAVRATYVTVDSTAASMTNTASPASFTISATKTMYGAAIFSINTRGDHTEDVAVNALYCYAKFTAGRAVVDNDVINCTYTLTTVDDAV
jgi:hypothetical protein